MMVPQPVAVRSVQVGLGAGYITGTATGVGLGAALAWLLFGELPAAASLVEYARAVKEATGSNLVPVGHAHTGSRAYLLFASFLQLPAFSLPLLESQGMPVGAQLIGHAGRDGDLCATARCPAPG